MTDFNFTENEKRAALYLVAECLDGMGGERPMDLEDDKFTWCHINVLVKAGWSKHGSLESKGALDIDHDTDYFAPDAWVDTIRDELYQWAESHWDEFEKSLSDLTDLYCLSASQFMRGGGGSRQEASMNNEKMNKVIEKAKAFCEENYSKGFDVFVECYDQKDWENEVVYDWYEKRVELGNKKEGDLMTWTEVRAKLKAFVKVHKSVKSEVAGKSRPIGGINY